LPFDSLPQLRQALVAEVPHLAEIDTVPENSWTPLPQGDLGKGDFVNPIRDFYLSNPIARASTIMAELSANAAARTRAAMAAE
jgi:NADH-quinone oxidoreductase subunit G